MKLLEIQKQLLSLYAINHATQYFIGNSLHFDHFNNISLTYNIVTRLFNFFFFFFFVSINNYALWI